MAEGAADPLQAGSSPGATHEKPKAERPAFSGNYRYSPTLTGAAVLQPKHATAEQAQLPERSHASPLGSSPSWRHAMWTAESRAFVGDFGAGQALSDEQYAVLAPLIRPAKPGGRPRTTDMRRLLDGLFWFEPAASGATCRHPRPSHPSGRCTRGPSQGS